MGGRWNQFYFFSKAESKARKQNKKFKDLMVLQH